MKKIRVVHIITGLSRGGAEIMLTKLVSVMDRSRFDQIVIVLKGEDELGEQIRKAGATVIALNMRGVWDFPRALLKTISLLKKLKPRIVQTWLYHADFLGTIATKAAGDARLIWNVRCSNMNTRDYSSVTYAILRILTRLSTLPDLVLVNSQAGQKAHSALGYRPKAWQVVPNGFDTEHFVPNENRAALLRRELGVWPSTPLIGLPARLDPMKDHVNFFQAASLLAKDRSDVQYVLIGAGLRDDNHRIASLVSQYDLEGRVHLLGERSDINLVMASLNIVTLCSAYGEGFPNVLGEGLSTGVLCVATDVGDAAAIVGPYGLIVPPRDPQKLALAWSQILSLDAQTYQDLSTKARQHIVDNYSIAAIGREYERLYGELA